MFLILDRLKLHSFSLILLIDFLYTRSLVLKLMNMSLICFIPSKWLCGGYEFPPYVRYYFHEIRVDVLVLYFLRAPLKSSSFIKERIFHHNTIPAPWM